MKVALRRSSSAIILSAVIAAAMLLLFSSSGTDPAHATNNFDLTVTRKYCNALEATFVDPDLQGSTACTNAIPTSDTPRTTTTNISIPSGDLNFSSILTFEPLGVAITPGCNINNSSIGGGGAINDREFTDGSFSSSDGIDNDSDGATDFGADSDGECLEPGDKVGGSRNETSLGLINGTCGGGFTTVDFIFFNVAIPNNPSNPRLSTNIFVPQAEGTSNRFSTAITDGGDAITGKADADSPAIIGYPDWLLDLFDPDWIPTLPALDGPNNLDGVGGPTDPRQNSADGPKKPIIPTAAYGAITSVTGTWTTLYFVQFPADVLSDDDNSGKGFLAPHPFSNALGTIGQPNQVVLTDTSEAEAFVSSITDFCTPLITDTMILGTSVDNTMIVQMHPPTAGSHPAFNMSLSQRDLDNDGLEGQIDTCPQVANIDGGPELSSGPDFDMIDSACDSTPATNTNGSDHDGDLFLNAQDNCPQVSNVSQAQAENQGDYSTSAPDGGPKHDAIGDACDSGTAVFIQNSKSFFSGTATGSTATTLIDAGQSFSGVVGKAVEITGGAGVGQTRIITGATGTELTVAPWITSPVDRTPDSSSTYTVGNTTSVTLSTTIANGHYHAVGRIIPTCYGPSETDADGDGWCASTSGETDTGAGADLLHPKLISWVTGGDADGDGTDAFLETFVGTDPTKACAATFTKNDEPLDARLQDTNDDTFVNISDVNPMKPAFGSLATDGNYNVRVDTNADAKVNISDVNPLKPEFGSGCTPDVQQ